MTNHHKPRRRLVGTTITDRAFDQLVPEELRHLSQIHWTPVDVAIRAAALLSPAGGIRILDVGAGIGKLCAIGALSASGTWCGVEQHEQLVAAARKLARTLGVVARTRFVHGDAFAVDWGEFDAIYLYNPFELPLFGSPEQELDSRVQIARVEDRLAALRPGARVVTLNGFGGVMPPSFRLVYHERLQISGLDLVLWVQHDAVGAARGAS